MSSFSNVPTALQRVITRCPRRNFLDRERQVGEGDTVSANPLLERIQVGLAEKRIVVHEPLRAKLVKQLDLALAPGFLE